MSTPDDARLLSLLAAIRYNAAALERAAPSQRAYLSEDITEAADLILTAGEWVEDAGPPIDVEVYAKSPVRLSDRRPRVEPVALMTFRNAA
jgi:hypothetical protein